MTEADTDGSDGDTPVVDGGEDLRFDAPADADVSVLTSGEPIREFVRLQTVLVDECVWSFHDDGITVQAVDPANVGMIDLDAHDGGFRTYRKRIDDDLDVGIPLVTGGNLKNALAFARKGRGNDNGDPVRIDIYDRGKRVRIAILRPDQNTKRVCEFYAIDPDSMRQKPDIPDLDLPYRADPGIEPLADGVQDMADHDHVWFTAEHRTLVVGSQPTRNPSMTGDVSAPSVDTLEFPNAAWQIDSDDGTVDHAHGSMFSINYLKDMIPALDRTKMDRLTVKFGNEFPTILAFEHDDWGFDGSFMLAPRISNDD